MKRLPHGIDGYIGPSEIRPSNLRAYSRSPRARFPATVIQHINRMCCPHAGSDLAQAHFLGSRSLR